MISRVSIALKHSGTRDIYDPTDAYYKATEQMFIVKDDVLGKKWIYPRENVESFTIFQKEDGEENEV